MKRFLKSSLSLILAITIIFSSAYVGLSEVDFSGLFAIKTKAASVDGLIFALNSDCASYSVTGYDTYEWGSLTIPATYNGKPVTNIGYNAFNGCYSLTSITIPDSVTSIGDSAFSQCGSLTSITIPDSVTSIGDFAFNECYSLTTITIPDSVTSIGVGAFSLCGGLTSVVIGDGVTSIGSNAFQHCTGLASITIPDSVISIGAYAFYCCINLTTITIPDSVTSIGDGAFQECYLTSINVGENNRYYSSDNGVLFNEDKTALIQYPVCKNELEYVIPNSVTCISDSAFYNCVSLATIAIPDSVTSIGSSAFYNTGYYNNSSNWENGVLYIGNHLIRAETSITGDYVIKNGTKTIADSAFVSCRSLTSITIPDSVISIGAYAFYYCINLTSITIPDSVTSIGKGAFQECYLTEINVDENNRYYSSDNGVLFNEAKTTLIQYPAGKNEAEYVIPNSVTSIGDMAFYNCALTSITIPNSVTSIGDGTFYGCSHLNDVYYGSTQADWSKIAIGANNSHLTDATIHYHEHSYSVDWIVDSEATCIEDGSKHKICFLCGDVVTETILAKGHNYSTEWTVDVEPTDTAMGSKSRHCLNCDAKTDVTSVSPKIIADVMSVETSGVLCNGEITYIIKPECYTGAIFNIVFDPDVLKPVDEKCGLYNYDKDITVVTGMVYETTDTYAIGAINSFCPADKGYLKITFEVKDYTQQETNVAFSCVEFISENFEHTKKDKPIQVSLFNEKVYKYDHNISSDWIVDVKPTCVVDGSKSHHCLKCDSKFDVTTIEALGHDYATEWTIDKEATCTETGSKSFHCKNCDGKLNVTNISAIGHSYTDWVVTKEVSCTENGKKQKNCLICGVNIEEEILSQGHSYSDKWTIDIEPTCTKEGSQSHHCIVCDAKTDVATVEAKGHTYGDWVVVMEPTCTESGEKTKACMECGWIASEKIPENGHNYSSEWTVDEAATCTENGSKSHHCTVCDVKTDITVIEPLSPETGCSFGLWQVEVEPTCSSVGRQARICKVCGLKQTSDIPELPHTHTDWIITKQPTCTEDGEKIKKCTICNEITTQIVIYAIGHAYGTTTVITPSTCSVNGMGKHSCDVCGMTEYCTLPLTEHAFGEITVVSPSTCSVSGAGKYLCDICGMTEYCTLPLGEHSYSDWIIDTAATVNAAGSKHIECTECGEVLETEVIPQLKPATPKLSKVENTASGVKVTWGKVSGADSYIVYRKTYNAKTKAWSGWTNLGKTTSTSYVDKAAKSGTYYLYTVRANNEAGLSGYNTSGIKTYFLSTPKLSSTANTNSAITVKWGKVTGASGYVVYRKTTSGWTKIATVKGNGTVTYTDKSIKAGVTYKYTVRAYYGSYLSSFDANGLAIRRLATPKLTKVVSAKNGITFTWGKVTGATGYVVYRKTGKGSWQKIATVKGVSTVKYLDKTAKKGTTYTYTVRAYYGTSNSAYNTKGLSIKDKY